MARNTDNPAPVWMKRVLLAAAAYNIVWGLVVLAAPNALFTLTGMEPPTYPMIFQCVGMIVGVYGVGYGIAAFNPARHWPIVLVGFLGKIFGPIGFLGAALTGELPWAFGLTIITNDLIWWLPFALILMFAWRTNTAPSGDAMAFDDAVAAAVDQNGTSLLDQSRVTPRLVVFLRHAGCTFCREALHDIGERRSAIESAGVTPVLVHMGPEDERTRAVVSRYGLEDLPRISDPARALYRAFELGRGGMNALFGPRVWIAGVRATLRGHLIGRLVGDGFQMPGVFLFRNGRIERSFRHERASDRPDYAGLACATA